MDVDETPLAALKQIVDSGVKDKGSDTALAASWRGFEQNYLPPGRRTSWNKSSELLFKELGLISRSSAHHCGINQALNKLDPKIIEVNWRKFFGSRYSQAELQIIEIAAASRVNITNFVNLLDVFNDLLIDAIYGHDASLGTYNLGKIGSVLYAPTGRFATKFPVTFKMAVEVHDRRYESMASHPLIKSSGKPTKKITYKFLPKAKKHLRLSISELQSAGLC